MPDQPSKQQVEVTDIQMRFGSMVVFMVKWAVASIPALIIVVVLAAALWAFSFGMIGGLLGGFSASRKLAATASGGGSSESSPEARPDPEQAAYISKVAVSGVKVAETELGGLGVFGEVKNTGNRSLEEVDIVVYYLGLDGKPVFEDSHYPVLHSSSGFSDAGPLKPGYSRSFGYRADSAPSAWDKKHVEVKVSKVEFQK